MILLSNIQSGLFNRVPKDFASIFFGGQVTTPPKVEALDVPAAKLAEYEGSYKTPSIPVPLNSKLKGGHLVAHWGTYPFARPLTPTSEDRFFLERNMRRLSFGVMRRGGLARVFRRGERGNR
ncbi:MAG: hypothetical protein HY040_18965 [Planctomycetes bacterium]|nr:hypothetical protein [Planctomycetota bacterium]